MAISEKPTVSGLPKLIPRKAGSPRRKEQEPILTPDLASVPSRSPLRFVVPSRRILSRNDHELFAQSPTHVLILSFVFSLSDAARAKSKSSAPLSTASDAVKGILSLLDKIESQIQGFPPEDQSGSRFGNPSFRPFIDAVESHSHEWHTSLFSTSSLPEAAIPEIQTYLLHSLGNRTRIDYGSGHELNFLIYLLCLNRLDILPPSTLSHLALLVFPRYIHLMRKIQSTYYLEPAGSHGVWGLDDYQFLPFLIGASQLIAHPYITPKAIHNELLVEEEGDECLYLDMIRYTTRSKTVKGLRWTQPMLDDISGAKNWGKVEQGMRRMFQNEVLGKLPVMQHFLFGELVPAVEGMTREREVGLRSEGEEVEGGEVDVTKEGEERHVHSGMNDGWGECCGIKIPSVVAAVTEEERRRKGEGELRRVPFD